MLEHVSVAEQHYGVRFVPVTRDELRSLDGCPWCMDGGNAGHGDRFRLFLGGKSSPRVWCRQCGGLQFLDSLNGQTFSDEELQALREEMEKRRQQEKEAQARALEKIMSSEDHIQYFYEITEEAVEYYLAEGLNHDSIQHYKLGYCKVCPTAPYSASYTIPVTYGGKLYNIRHRLISPNGSGKYRPHAMGLPPMLFNADLLDVESSVGLLTEGEKKSMVVTQETGIPSVGIMGNSNFSPGWAQKFDNWGRVIVIMDPDTDTIQKMRSSDEKAITIAKAFGGRGSVAVLPVKLDDFFARIGGTKADFMNFLKEAIPVA
jgi:hypothetical protein